MENQKLILVEYDPSWKLKFDREKQTLLSQAFKGELISINHIGSTSIAGMMAKPIIDIGCEIQQYPPSNELISQLNKLGYEDQGECGVTGRTWLIKGTPREFHLHLTPVEGDVFKSQIKFRDKLRESRELREEYCEIKMKFHGHFELDSHEYNLHKGPFIEKVLGPDVDFRGEEKKSWKSHF
jgi:GrpB-like predicted nucleotidyltransferase (UPF0157 family)